MSRNYRGREFTPRWGLPSISKKARFTKSETMAYLNRMIARANRAAGYSSAKSQPHRWHFEEIVENEAPQQGSVVAHTRSEARALIKKELNIPKSRRLPQSIVITKGEACPLTELTRSPQQG